MLKRNCLPAFLEASLKKGDAWHKWVKVDASRFKVGQSCKTELGIILKWAQEVDPKRWLSFQCVQNMMPCSVSRKLWVGPLWDSMPRLLRMIVCVHLFECQQWPGVKGSASEMDGSRFETIENRCVGRSCNLTSRVRNPIIDVVWKFGEGVSAQVPSSSCDCGSEASRNTLRVVSKGNIFI
ncbi:hypothetical protein AVEN_28138-1 [Araneus ventricosus]|uniref:Uncharacterized protein n=1 Tax=Araneus ventricosus TaxID=182803 RepID=A0A4Y2GG71_ARAVE|nr:hypothetical protein AVEN_28138-1 [Araneus ventricosus]